MKNKIIVFICIITITIGSFCENTYGKSEYNKNYDKLPRLYSMCAAVIDGETGRVLFEKNGNDERAMASTTKIMTLILALEYGHLEDVVTVSSYASKMPDVQLGIEAGEKYYLKDLLFSLILESHNDTAVAIAEHIAGNVDKFSDLMNSKAKSIGLCNTYFITPNGLDEKDDINFHHTTAIELAKIMKYCVFESDKKESFIKICQTKSYSFSDLANKKHYNVYNKNAFLDMYDGVLAGKTGFTADAGYCYVCATVVDNKKYVVALLAAGWPNHKNYKWIDCRALLDYVSLEYNKKDIIDNSYNFKKVKVANGIETSIIKPIIYENYSVLLSKDDRVDITIDLPNTIKAPIYKNNSIGSLYVYINDNLVKTIPIYSGLSVKKINYKYVCCRFIKRIFNIQ